MILAKHRSASGTTAARPRRTVRGLLSTQLYSQRHVDARTGGYMRRERTRANGWGNRVNWAPGGSSRRLFVSHNATTSGTTRTSFAMSTANQMVSGPEIIVLRSASAHFDVDLTQGTQAHAFIGAGTPHFELEPFFISTAVSLHECLLRGGPSVRARWLFFYGDLSPTRASNAAHANPSFPRTSGRQRRFLNVYAVCSRPRRDVVRAVVQHSLPSSSTAGCERPGVVPPSTAAVHPRVCSRILELRHALNVLLPDDDAASLRAPFITTSTTGLQGVRRAAPRDFSGSDPTAAPSPPVPRRLQHHDYPSTPTARRGERVPIQTRISVSARCGETPCSAGVPAGSTLYFAWTQSRSDVARVGISICARPHGAVRANRTTSSSHGELVAGE